MRRQRTLRAAATAATALTLGIAGIAYTEHAAADTTSVTIAGDLQSEIGCAGDWATDCSASNLSRRTDGMWSRTVTVPAGTWAYKAALNGSWTENYGAHAAPGGGNITLTVPAGGKAVTFLYDPVTHWITDDVTSRIVTAAGDFQSELGCTGDWAPDCLRTWLQDIDGDGVYTYTTTAIPAGTWAVKATIGQSWAESYGGPNGANIPFTVTTAGSTTTIRYDSASHQLTVTGSGGEAATGTLGATYTAAATTFRLWSPDNTDVKVIVGGTTYPATRVSLPGYTDVYQASVTGNLKNQAYQFTVGGTAVRDPYARMVNPGTSQGIVVDPAAITPTSGTWRAAPPLANREDAVIYELSVRDFTIDGTSGVSADKRGKFLGLVQTGTAYNGAKTGIDHLKELGVNTVQIMPAYDFASTVPNWGYDPLNYNVPEEQFSQFTAPAERMREFADMVDEFHRNGIRVILDVVYNHTATKDVLQGITGKYYTATDYSGCCGNSLDDSQPMVSRMIRDSLEMWVRDYHVDGFRFDLMGIFHHDQVAGWGTYLNTTYPDRNLQLYGEPWMGGVTPPAEADFVRYGSTASMTGGHIGVFNGAYRDAIKGGTRDQVLGYMGGAGNQNAVTTGLRGSPLATKSTAVLSDLWNPAFAYDPEQTINYVSAHDDLNLWDKITYSGVTGGADGRAGRMDRFAAGIVLTSQGIPLFTEGDEFLRSKVVGGDYETAANSYNAGDNVNAIRWNDKVTNAGTFAYYKAAIALRKATPGMRLTTWDAVNTRHSTQVSGQVITSVLDSTTVAVYNPGASSVNATLPAGSWTKVLDATGAVTKTDTTADALATTVFRKN
ncbi:pullulanase X25 domain-containing protein [Winogradskya humida]|uniref:Glycosyl hydrolase family 13 catalytic domain-containing protein n=1 Tax=Winogradskya humida TaxID=113566 RepID=A0ABQ4A7E3_9ACTN|nr:alpha-amylase family glycosyl hydrolase [Actinoplanes humidus]GIE26786.1 hypothetical protein Ahu01nite_098880 [Actinoplanes humidus]